MDSSNGLNTPKPKVPVFTLYIYRNILTFLHCAEPQRRCHSINEDELPEDTHIIAIDRACYNNGQDKAKMSVGVPWARHGYARHYNIAKIVDNIRKTSQTAELIAFKHALWPMNKRLEVDSLSSAVRSTQTSGN